MLKQTAQTVKHVITIILCFKIESSTCYPVSNDILFVCLPGYPITSSLIQYVPKHHHHYKTYQITLLHLNRLVMV